MIGGAYDASMEVSRLPLLCAALFAGAVSFAAFLTAHRAAADATRFLAAVDAGEHMAHLEAP